MVFSYLSVCSGIEAASVGWAGLGWRCAGLSEIEPFPRAVLQHHFPEVPLYGDFTQIQADDVGSIDLLVGGTPCQSFSVAGLRGGLGDDRGNLALGYIKLAERTRPRWLVWENVPGVFSSSGGEDFRCFLSGLVRWRVTIPEGGWQNSGVIAAGPVDGAYGVAWRVLDAQHFGVPQRRRRVFVVGYLGDWRRAAAVLFERKSLQGDSPPRREKGQIAPTIPARSTGGGGLGTDFDCDGGLIERKWPAEMAPTLNAHFGDKMGLEDQHALNGAGLFVPAYAPTTAHSLRGEGFDASEDGTGRGTSLVATAVQERAISENPASGPQGKGYQEDTAFTLEARGTPQAVAFALRGRDAGAVPEVSGEVVNALRSASGGSTRDMIASSAVRRLTPVECERLQGFPDNWTRIPYRNKPTDKCPDGPRYKTIGNSMAVPVMRWMGERISMVEITA